MKKRFLFNELKKYLSHKNALVVTGMRQVGKTTLMKQLYEDVDAPKLWFDFDNPLDVLHFESINYDDIYENLKKEAGAKSKRLFVFIDEIQSFPEITKIIKYHIDKYGAKYVVTGSSNFYLRNLFPESLSGRKFLFILYPMGFKEFLFFNDKLTRDEIKFNFLQIEKDNLLIQYKKFESDYNDFLEYGGFPEVVVTESKETKLMILKNIFASFFEKDINILSEIKEIRELRDLILLLAPRAGNILDITKLASELKISRNKVYHYLEMLQGFFFLYLIPKFSKSIDRSVAGGKKVYFADTGLLNIVGRVNEGQLFENAVANQLREYGELSFFNNRNKSEIDFILNKEIALEVKINAIERDNKKLERSAEKLGIKEYYLISKNYADLPNVICPMSF